MTFFFKFNFKKKLRFEIMAFNENRKQRDCNKADSYQLSVYLTQGQINRNSLQSAERGV